MKDLADKTTVDLFVSEKRLGRPVTGTAKTNAERMRLYRKNRKEQGVRVVLQRPDDIERNHEEMDYFYRELDELRQERDAAIKRVAELEKMLQVDAKNN